MMNKVMCKKKTQQKKATICCLYHCHRLTHKNNYHNKNKKEKNVKMSKTMSKKMMNMVTNMKTMSVEHKTYLADNLMLA
jgi:hypothetical protein